MIEKLECSNLKSQIYKNHIFFQQAVVSNLQTSVSQEDLSELFGDVGPLRRVKMLGPGSAEIVFLNKVCYLIFLIKRNIFCEKRYL